MCTFKPLPLSLPALARAVCCPVVAWAAVCASLCAVPAGAAPVSANADLATSPPLPATGSVLDRALSSDVGTGSRNVDLLLELRRHDAAEAGRPESEPVPAAPARPMAGERSAGSAAAVSPPAERLPLAQGGGWLGADGPVGSTPAAPAQATGRSWRGAAAGDTGATGAPVAPAGAGGAPPGEPSLVFRLPGLLLHGAREYRYWVLGAIAVAIALGAAYKRLNRRL